MSLPSLVSFSLCLHIILSGQVLFAQAHPLPIKQQVGERYYFLTSIWDRYLHSGDCDCSHKCFKCMRLSKCSLFLQTPDPAFPDPTLCLSVLSFEDLLSTQLPKPELESRVWHPGPSQSIQYVGATILSPAFLPTDLGKPSIAWQYLSPWCLAEPPLVCRFAFSETFQVWNAENATIILAFETLPLILLSG